MAEAATQRYGTLITNIGTRIIASALATGVKLGVTHVALGDGGGYEYYPSASQEDIRNQVYIGDINAIDTDPLNPSWLVVEMSIPGNIGGWWIREAALRTDDGTTIAVASVPTHYKPVLSDGASVSTNYRLVFEVSNTAAITLKIDPSISMATKEYVDLTVNNHAKQTNVHGGTYERTPNRLAHRNGDGRIQVGEPVHDFDATTRKYVDATIAAKLTAFQSTWDRLQEEMKQQVEDIKKSSGIEVGDIFLKAQSPSELKKGWYLCDGGAMALSSPQGQALAGLSADFKARWNIVVSGNSITRPNWFASDGRGVFPRAVDGRTRHVGTIELDQFQGHGHDLRNGGASVRAGASREIPNLTNQRVPGGTGAGWQAMDIITDGNNGDPRIGDETRPLNVGMTPAIYLGV
ncbi:MAG: phage tail protein [Planctomycetaceae bacterium]|nr:phage tail protein [Planctomycetaceae bacterium]